MVVGWRSSLGFVRRKGSLVVETYAVLGWVCDGWYWCVAVRRRLRRWSVQQGRGCDDCAVWPHGCRRCLGELLGFEGVGKGLSVGLLAVYVG